MKYHIWTEGCQMNVADSQRVASALEHLGYSPAVNPQEADVIVLNTCVVRQSAEDKALSWLHSLRPLKKQNPNLVINLMGCLVGIKDTEKLKQRFPFVDVFSAPSDPAPLVTYLSQIEGKALEQIEQQHRLNIQDGDFTLPSNERGKLVAAYVPVVLGCSHACTFCVIPYRRGAERSRPAELIMAEARSLVQQGVREITLLGQIVDRYGKDLPEGPNLADLLHLLNQIEGLERIRFLTSHPSYLNDELLDAVAELPKVMPHIEVPVQAGDNDVLENMRRGYTVEDYYQLVDNIRFRLRHKTPGVSIATDIIVGFPSESEAQFLHTYHLLEDLRLDVAHLARYSARPGTVASRHLSDDISESEKWRRFRILENLQEGIAAEINAAYQNTTVDVLFEEKVRGRWKGRTSTNKLVFVASEENLLGQICSVQITWTGPWSMQAILI